MNATRPPRTRPTTARTALSASGLLVLAVALLLLAGCAGPDPLLKRSRASGPQWPESPFAARIEWVKSVATPEDAGIAKGFWKKALELITGKDLRRIVKPYGVLFDDAGRLIIADPGAGVVHLMETKEARYSVIKGEPGLPLLSPIGLAEDQRGGLYITDSAANTVYRYDLVSRKLAPFLVQRQRPTGIAYNAVNKLLYISETTAHRVIAVDGAGVEKYRFEGASGQSLFNYPTDVAIDPRGQVLVSDPLNYKVRVFSPEGLAVSPIGEMGDSPGEMSKPKGVAVDGAGRIYICDALLDAVQIFDDSGRFLFSFGSAGSADGSFWMPSGIAIHGKYIFVADTFNQRVQIFRYLTDAEQDENDKSDKQNNAR